MLTQSFKQFLEYHKSVCLVNSLCELGIFRIEKKSLVQVSISVFDMHLKFVFKQFSFKSKKTMK